MFFSSHSLFDSLMHPSFLWTNRTLLQYMFVQRLCIPTIWHYYTRWLAAFFFFLFIFVFHNILCGSTDDAFLCSIFISSFGYVFGFLWCAAFSVLVFTCFPFPNGDRVLVIVDCVGSCGPFTLCVYSIRIGKRLP